MQARPAMLTPLNLGPAPAAGAGAAAPEQPGRKVAVLLPLTGPNAELGNAMLQAAQLALGGAGGPAVVPEDTHGTADGAAQAARDAVAAGAGIILGPLTNADTAAAAPVARAAGVPMLAFTSDPAQAQPGVWTLGITPAQQVRPLIGALQAEGKTRVAAVLPQNGFGDALMAGLRSTAKDAGLPEPRIVQVPYQFRPFNDALKSVSDYEARRPAIEAAARGAPADPAAPPPPDIPPPPMDALLLGATGYQGMLAQTVPLLQFYDIGAPQVRVLGPASWLRDAAGQPNLAGAWFAAPDPAFRKPFEQAYAAKFGAPPRDLTSLAYDAAGIARAAAGPGGFQAGLLTRPEGFTGADGLVALLPDGHVRRGLAIFEVDRGGSHIVQPAPQTLSAQGA